MRDKDRQIYTRTAEHSSQVRHTGLSKPVLFFTQLLGDLIVLALQVYHTFFGTLAACLRRNFRLLVSHAAPAESTLRDRLFPQLLASWLSSFWSAGI
jgi:hypothetical protein